MTFIVIFIALLIERFFDWSHLRHWGWYNQYEHFILQRIPKNKKNPTMLFAAVVLPLLILMMLVEYLLTGVLYGFMSLVFDIAILIYCLGPQNLWADTFACVNALSQGDAHLAADKLKVSFGIADSQYKQTLHRHFLNNIFIQANHRVFAVAFWFAALGPAGAVLYRAMMVIATETPKQGTTSVFLQYARLMQAGLDWLPVRVFTFIFALGGHFSKVMAFWGKKAFKGVDENDVLLTECGTAALGLEDQPVLVEDGSVEKHAVSMLDRSFVIALALLLVGVLVF
jgi:AmpE protein